MTQQMAGAVGRNRGPAHKVGKNDVLMQALHNTPLFSLATDRELRRVVAQSEHLTAKGGTTLMREGEPGDRFYVVIQGTVRITRNGRTIAKLGAGDAFGELALLTASPRNATASVVDDADLVTFSRKSFAKLLDAGPLFARRLMQAIAARLREHDSKSIQ